MRLVYVIGEPGVGKTTAVRGALSGYQRVPTLGGPFAHELIVDGGGRVAGVHLGVDRDPFGGTDTLSMAVQPRVLGWLPTAGVPLVVGEGDRLGTCSFLTAAAAVPGVRLTLVALTAAPGVAAARRAARGTGQNPVWVAGRVTKVTRLTALAAVVLDGAQPPAATAAALRAVLFPER